MNLFRYENAMKLPLAINHAQIETVAVKMKRSVGKDGVHDVLNSSSWSCVHEQLRWPSGKSVRLVSCRLGVRFRVGSNQ